VTPHNTFHDTAHIISKTQHDLRGPVPPRCDILCHEALITSSFRGATAGSITPCETKIADFELTVGVDEEISRFEITVKDVRRVYVLETAKSLVEEGLEVGVSERLSRTNLVKFKEVILESIWRQSIYLQWREDRLP